MVELAAKGEVKFKVARLAYSLGEFTVKRLATITGLNEKSIRTHLDRMKKDGYLEVVGQEELAEGTTGRPALIYRVVSDPVKRTRLMEEITAFYVPSEETAYQQPQSPHYRRALDIMENELRRASCGLQPSTAALAVAQRHLETAADDESVGEKGTEVATAWVKCATAKLKALAGDLNRAVQLKQEADKAFEENGVEEAQHAVADIARYICGTQLGAMAVLSEAMAAHDYELVLERTEALRQVLDHLTPEDPRILISVKTLTLLETSCRESLAWQESLRERVDTLVRIRLERNTGRVVKTMFGLAESRSMGFSVWPEFFQTLDATLLGTLLQPSLTGRILVGNDGITTGRIPQISGARYELEGER